MGLRLLYDVVSGPRPCNVHLVVGIESKKFPENPVLVVGSIRDLGSHIDDNLR